MSKCDNTCHGCLWADSCGFDSRCDDYTPMNDEQDIAYYEKILEENGKVYRFFLEKEFS